MLYKYVNKKKASNTNWTTYISSPKSGMKQQTTPAVHTKRYETADHCWKFNHDFNWTENKILGHELNTTTRKIKEAIHSIKTENCINGISYKLLDIWLPAIKVKHDGNIQTENNRQNSPNRVHWGPQFQKPAKSFLMCPHRSEFNTHIRFHPPNYLPETSPV